jgi:surface antigen
MIAGSLTAFAVVSMLALPTPTEAAQRGQLLWGFLPPLTEEDMALAQDAARVEMAGKPEGTRLTWSNPESGNSGTAILIRRYDVDGRECRKIRHDLKIKDERDMRMYVVTICLQEDGSWKWP